MTNRTYARLLPALLAAPLLCAMAPGDMSVAAFLARAASLERLGPLALATPQGNQLKGEVVAAGAPASETLHHFDPLPQLLKNVRFAGGKPLEVASVKDTIAAAEAELEGRGRLVIRPSGTEPVIRVMAEGDDASQVEAVVDRICAAVKAARPCV